jgi:DNA-binding transcriptional LysR family regulator
MDKNIQKYQAVLTASEEGNITAAADRLGYTQSSVSKMISDVESEWGIQVFERSKKGVKLTLDGEDIMPYVRQLLDSCSALDIQVNDVKGCETGSIRIGLFSSVAEQWMPELIGRFHKAHPNISYELLTGDYDEIEKWLDEGRVDLGFLRLPAGKGLKTMEICRDHLMAVLPKDHPLASKKKIDPEDLDCQNFLLLEHGGKTEVSEFLEEYKVKPDISFTTWDDYAIMAMAEKGQGIGILPELILRRIPYDVAIRPLSVPAYRTIGAAVKSREYMSSAIRKFIDFMKDNMDLMK